MFFVVPKVASTVRYFTPWYEYTFGYISVQKVCMQNELK